jgi:4-hydroxythreonine-4-phosphate dehydrogenase
MAPLSRIAVTIGDPAGIGPEIVARLFAGYRPGRSCAVLVGAPGAYGPWLAHSGLEAPTLADPTALADPDLPPVVLLDTGVTDPFTVAAESPGGGRHAGRAIEIACELVRNRSAAAICTAPISKKALNLGDFHFAGHTEMLAQYLNSPDCQMMMVYKDLRVVPMTRHVPLREVAGRVTPELIETCVRETRRGLVEWFGIPAPKIAVAGLNPHAGEGGVIGSEEMDVIAPALTTLRGDGIDVEGPLPADALFQTAGRAQAPWDAYIAMYHDQGLVPFKLLAQRRGVNVTVGLPAPRTSVDHGSAYDIAGRGIAETGSLREAYELAETLAGNRRPS